MKIIIEVNHSDLQGTDEDVEVISDIEIISENHFKVLPLQGADEDIKVNHSEVLPLQGAEGIEVISENQEDINDTKGILDNASKVLLLKDVTKDSERLTEETLKIF